MALTKLTKDMDIIQKLGDEPNDVDGMTSAELKAKFDEGNNAMKQWVNDTFIPEVEKEIKASRLENLPEHAHTHAKDGRDPITPESIGARPDTWLPTIAEIGAAPAGYGLGVHPYSANGGVADITTLEQLDNATECGWYSVYFRGEVLNNVKVWSAILRVSSYVSDRVVQEMFIPDRKTWLTRSCYDSAFDEWACDNPPMQLGVEYRTTERWNGKPVYARAFDFGAVGVGGQTAKSIGTYLQDEVKLDHIEFTDPNATGDTSNKVSGQWDAVPHAIAYAKSGNGNIIVDITTTSSFRAGMTAVAYLKYTKRAD